MKKDLLVLSGKLLCLEVCACRNSCELYGSFLISFMEFLEQVLCDKDSSQICMFMFHLIHAAGGGKDKQ